jgi:hypothetical protein
MATRSLKVEFVPVGVLDSVSPDPQVHDVSVDASVVGAPQVLENPHVDFPGTWRLLGEGAGGAYRYERAARVAETNDTLAG